MRRSVRFSWFVFFVFLWSFLVLLSVPMVLIKQNVYYTDLVDVVLRVDYFWRLYFFDGVEIVGFLNGESWFFLWLLGCFFSYLLFFTIF